MSSPTQPGSIAIIGGGVIGIACAHYLRRAGFGVTVIDRATPGEACSSGNCGYICPSHVLPLTEPGAIRAALKSMLKPNSPFYVKPRLSPALWHWMMQFARRCTHQQMVATGQFLHAILQSSMHEYRQLVAQHELNCQWTPHGLLYVLSSEYAMDEFGKTDRLLTEQFGVVATRIEGEKLTQFDPAIKPGMAGAFHYEGDAHLRPDHMVRNWKHRLESQGVEFIADCEVTGIECQGKRVATIRTTKHCFSPEQVVIATGAWSSAIGRWLGCSLPIQPGKGYSITTTKPDPCVGQATLFPEHRVGVTPFVDGYRIGSMMEFVGYDESIPEKRIRQLRDSASHYLVSSVATTEISRWYGWRPMTWDSLPIIGRVPRLDNALLATGHNMLGMSMATATGRLVAELASGQTPHIDIAGFSPKRFN